MGWRHDDDRSDTAWKRFRGGGRTRRTLGTCPIDFRTDVTTFGILGGYMALLIYNMKVICWKTPTPQ